MSWIVNTLAMYRRFLGKNSVSNAHTNSFFWLPASALAALALGSLIIACSSLSSDAMLHPTSAAASTPTQAADASR